MEWLIATGLFIGAMAILPMLLRSNRDSLHSGNAIAGIVDGMAEALDPKAALISQENQKRTEAESEEEAGADPGEDEASKT